MNYIASKEKKKKKGENFSQELQTFDFPTFKERFVCKTVCIITIPSLIIP